MRHIDAARERAGMTQDELAELVGVSQSQMSRMLSGVRPVTVPELLKMCDVLHLDAARVIALASP